MHGRMEILKRKKRRTINNQRIYSEHPIAHKSLRPQFPGAEVFVVKQVIKIVYIINSVFNFL